MKQLFLLPMGIAALITTGCEKPTASETSGSTGSTTATAPDNTGVNTRDRSGDTPTPMDQGQNQTDVNVAAEIRRAITDDSAMSLNGRNCKVIVAGGVVTLRGPVDSQAEKDAIGAKAGAVAGVTSVVNELEVKGP